MWKKVEKVAKVIMYVFILGVVGAAVIGTDLWPLPDPVTRAYAGFAFGAVIGLWIGVRRNFA